LRVIFRAPPRDSAGADGLSVAGRRLRR
jgi:hypothetical protein